MIMKFFTMFLFIPDHLSIMYMYLLQYAHAFNIKNSFKDFY